MFANFTTLAHFALSASMNFAKSAGETGNTVAPKLDSFDFNFGSAKPELICLLSLSMISTGVFFGAPIPFQALAS